MITNQRRYMPRDIEISAAEKATAHHLLLRFTEVYRENGEQKNTEYVDITISHIEFTTYVDMRTIRIQNIRPKPNIRCNPPSALVYSNEQGNN